MQLHAYHLTHPNSIVHRRKLRKYQNNAKSVLTGYGYSKEVLFHRRYSFLLSFFNTNVPATVIYTRSRNWKLKIFTAFSAHLRLSRRFEVDMKPTQGTRRIGTAYREIFPCHIFQLPSRFIGRFIGGNYIPRQNRILIATTRMGDIKWYKEQHVPLASSRQNSNDIRRMGWMNPSPAHPQT